MADIRLIAFTQKGLELSKRIADGLMSTGDDASCAKGFGEGKVNHHQWTAEAFAEADALVFVSATGIAVRSIAPYVVAKDQDPAVIVIDEGANYCIPLLSGHIGGANALAKRICAITGAAFAVTTASDVNGVFAVDTWATEQGLKVLNTPAIKDVTSRLLAGETVTFESELPIIGMLPKGVETVLGDQAADIHIGIHPNVTGLNLIPRIAIVGIGCRKGTEQARIADAFTTFLRENNVVREAICTIASIDLKKDEPGLVAFAQDAGLPFQTFSETELNALEGAFSSSDFVQGVTGVSCVCERASVAAGGVLAIPKTVIDGITFALAVKPCTLNWSD
ncbi:MAG: cobalamin biosynthesis protein [Eggerthellaceae bacterium]|nr:cobalamin biosynthesis protein [Eggerthellaceae bacterium]